MLLKDNNPWLGLESYSVKDSNRFYGRDHDIEIVSNSIYDNFITTIYGISGAGKTSLINAGITPALKGKGYLPIRIRLSHKSAESYDMQIINAICSAVESVDGEVEFEGHIDLESIHENEKLWFFLHTRKFWSHDNYPIKPVLFIDQFEEIFTQNSEGEKISNFFESINSVQHTTPPAFTRQLLEEDASAYTELNMNISRIVLIIREDFLARLEDYSYGIAALRRNRIGIKRMNGSQALDVILKPNPDIVTTDGAIRILSKVSGKEVTFSEKSLAQLSIDTSILSLFCSELYQRAVETGNAAITVDLIEEFGNDIIAKFYSDNMSHVDPALAEYLERHLLTSSGFRNSVAYEDITIPKVSKEVVSKGLELLTEKRILRIEDVDGVVRVEFTHDVLCKVAKAHRASIKEESEKKRTLIKTTVKSIEQIAICLIAGIALMYGNYRFQELPNIIFRPDWLLACGLFFSLFINRNKERSKFLNFSMSILLSLLLSRLPLCVTSAWISTSKIYLSLAIWASSIPLSYWAFCGNASKSKVPILLLTGLDLVLMFEFNQLSFVLTSLLIPLLATMPLKYSTDKNVSKICILATVAIFLIAVILESASLAILAIYPLFGLIFKRHDESESFKSSLGKCIRFEAWKNDRTWTITASIILSLSLMLYLSQISTSKSDAFIIYQTPIAALLIYCLLTFKKATSAEGLKSIYKRGVMISGIALLIIGFQYITYGFCFMLAIWLAVAAYVAHEHRQEILSRKISPEYAAKVARIAICTCAIPLFTIGYNVSSNIKYAKVIGKELSEKGLFVIRDNKGNYGVRDNNNIIVPVEFSDIESYVKMEGIPYTTILKSWDYMVASDSSKLPKWLTFDFGGGYYTGMDESLSHDIIFTLQTKNGERVAWHCNEHLSEWNLCTAVIFECIGNTIYDSHTFREDQAQEVLISLKGLGRNTSEVAQKIILKQFEKTGLYTSRRNAKSLEFNSLKGLKEAVKGNMLEDYLLPSTIRMCHKTLSYVEDPEFVNYILDTLYKQTGHQNHQLWEYYNDKAQFYIYTNQLERAVKCASTAMMYDSTLTYGYKNLIVAKALMGEYDEAYELLNTYGEGMHYMGSMSEIREGDTEVNIIHNKSNATSILLRFNNLYNGINNELNSLESWNVTIDTTSSSYKDFKEFVKSKCIKPYDSAEDKGGYYLCRKYEYYLTPTEEYYAGYPNNEPRYKLAYQFYMKDNVAISPAFDAYGDSHDESIKLLIDYDDTKRKYIDMRGEVPEMIPGEYDHAWNFSEGMAAVVKNGKLGFINSDGEYVIDSIFTYSNDARFTTDRYNRQTSDILNYTFSDGRCLMKGDNGKGLIDKKGNWIIQPEYSHIYPIYATGLWLLEKPNGINSNVKYGIANNDGKIILAPEYDEIIQRSNILYQSQEELESNRSHYGYFGKDGEYISIWLDSSQADGIYIEDGHYTINNEYDHEFGIETWYISHPDGELEEHADLQRSYPT